MSEYTVYNGLNLFSWCGFFLVKFNGLPCSWYRSALHLATNCLPSNCLCLRINWILAQAQRVWIGSGTSDCTNSVAHKAHSQSGSESEHFLWYLSFFFDFFAFAPAVAWCELAIKHSMRCKTRRSTKATSFLIRSCSERCQNNERFKDFFAFKYNIQAMWIDP